MPASMNISSYVYDLPCLTAPKVLWQYYTQHLNLSTPLYAIAGSAQVYKQNIPSSVNLSNYVYNLPWLSVPHVLWRYYIQYLWNYDSTSWVARVSSTIRVFAILLILPVAILGMLDLSSYVIARTLGVVDAVKASTNDKPVGPINPPSILVEDMSTLNPGLIDSTHGSIPTPSDSITSTDEEPGGLAALASLDVFMFSNEKLSGVGVFSPASSRPSSPTLSRRKLKESKSPKAEMNILPEIEGLSVRKRIRHGGTENGVE
jgi:hypothetical protein